MIRKIGFKLAVDTMLALLSAVVLFHLLVLIGVVPYGIVWGGRLESVEAMRVFESISITINLLVIAIIAMKAGRLRRLVPVRVLNVLLWGLVVLFSLNTVGNLLALATVETIVFTPLTLVSAVLCARVALE